jgi:hypothetical protein
MPRTVFYAWQSDTDESVNHHFIAEALKGAIARLNVDLQVQESERELKFDRDTHGEPGMPPIADTILRKIREAAVFVADLTFVARIETPDRLKGLPNANVGIELGFAACALGFERMLCVLNTHYGEPKQLPFDLAHRQFPACYTLAPDATEDTRKAAAERLTGELTTALRTIVNRMGLSPKEESRLAHAAAPLEACSFVESANGPIARARSRDDEGRDSEHVYWHHSPSAWLRLIPTHGKQFERLALRQRVERAAPPLRAFGDAPRQQIESNRYGIIVLGYDGGELPHIAMQLTQVFRSGEIWGLNRSLIEPRVTKPMRTFQIPWPEVELQFRQMLANYLDFAREALDVSLPLTLVAGLAMVRDAEFVGQKAKWFSNPPPRTRCFKDFVHHQAMIPKWGIAQGPLLDPFFRTILDECDQDSSEWLEVLRPKP